MNRITCVKTAIQETFIQYDLCKAALPILRFHQPRLSNIKKNQKTCLRMNTTDEYTRPAFS